MVLTARICKIKPKTAPITHLFVRPKFTNNLLKKMFKKPPKYFPTVNSGKDGNGYKNKHQQAQLWSIFH